MFPNQPIESRTTSARAACANENYSLQLSGQGVTLLKVCTCRPEQQTQQPADLTPRVPYRTKTRTQPISEATENIMKGRLLKGLLAVVGLSLCALLMGTAAPNDTAPTPPGKTTFYKDVLPILQNNCQSCNRWGEVAPMSLITYDETRPFAIAIKMAVLTKKMPPWYADPQFGHFSNERKLSPQDIRTLVSWVDGGAQPGNAKDAPPPLKFVDGWNIGQPDRVIEMPVAYHLPAEGTVEYQYMVIPGNFTQDTWVRAAEIRPGNRAVVHHVIAFIRSPESKFMREAKPGEFFVPKKENQQ